MQSVIHEHEKTVMWSVFIGLVLGVCTTVLAFMLVGRCP
jgi:heme/copper-type cytochrome/quinol oxidase subunit 4